MKKVLLTVFAACLVFAASAQFKGGIKAGLNLANGTDDFDGADMLTTFHAGVYGQFGLSDKLMLQPELLFYGAGDSEDDIDIKLTYISLPIMFKYAVAEQFNIQAGPQIGFLTKAEFDGVDIKDDLKGTDFGLNIGVGGVFGKFSADARYSIGLSNIVDVSGVEAKNNVIQISLGYQLFGE